MAMGFSRGFDLEEKERQNALIDESRGIQERGVMEVQHPYHQNGDKNDAVFWPVEHPLEPPDEDHPVQCPMPESSVINDGRLHEKRFPQSLRKIAEVPAAMVDGVKTVTTDTEPPPARAVYEHHHTLTQGHGGDLVITPLVTAPSSISPLPAQNVTIFQMLQEPDEFES